MGDDIGKLRFAIGMQYTDERSLPRVDKLNGIHGLRPGNEMDYKTNLGKQEKF